MTLDFKERKICLDTSKSFIVQAPAGSGKTSILVQRYLALLAKVEKQPEEILAITFTRAASSEMRKRIIQALINAKEENKKNKDLSSVKPTIFFDEDHNIENDFNKIFNCENDFDKNLNNHLTYEQVINLLAKKVLKRDEKENWNLISNPSRLKIQTFDALCASITRKMPLATNFGKKVEVLNEPEVLYEIAIDEFLKCENLQKDWSDALDLLLLHLDNDWNLLKKLFIEMLAKREQWLGYIVAMNSAHDTKTILEKGLEKEITNTLLRVKQFIMAESKNIPTLKNIPALACFAANNLRQKDEKNSLIIACDILNTDWPGSNFKDLDTWKGLSELLLTKSGQIRKSVTKAQGFFSQSKITNKEVKRQYVNNKNLMLECLEQIHSNKMLIKSLNEIVKLPYPKYDKEDWEIIKSICTLLPVIVGYLQVTFKEKGKVDFSEVTIATDYALGEKDNCSDLGLSLGYKINHILVDEFQDTSIAQYNLLEKITSTWEANENKTLFFVGDPMQSIYLFRQAEVGLFLTVKEFGLGNIKLIPLSLKVNFRSSSQIVNWINKLFLKIFPLRDDISSGAISFSRSYAYKETRLQEDDGQIELNNIDEDNLTQELEIKRIVEIIKNEKQKNKNSSVAILVRSRTHLQKILPALKNNNIEFRGVEIESLTDSEIVKDLLALTNAVLHLGDRISWLAVLRAPWCGLKLNDLYILSNAKDRIIIFENMLDEEVISSLSQDGQLRVKKIVQIMLYSISLVSKINIRELIFNLWINLNGPECLTDKIQEQDAYAFFEFLSSISDERNKYYEVGYIESKLTKLYAKSVSTLDNPIEIMTIHKAKGLEFDIVILPSLDRKPTVNKNKLFFLNKKIDNAKNEYLLFSAIKSVRSKENKIYEYLKYIFEQKETQEISRLFYVACTRTKSKLFCLANFKNFAKNSFLDLCLDFLPWDQIKNINIENNIQDNNGMYDDGYGLTEDEKYIAINNKFDKVSKLNNNSEISCIKENNQSFYSNTIPFFNNKEINRNYTFKDMPNSVIKRLKDIYFIKVEE